MRRVMVAILVVLGMATGAGAETLGAWTYTPPPGWDVKTGATFVLYSKIVSPTYCTLAIYAPRAPGADAATDAGTEWAQIVDPVFTSSDIKADPPRTTKQKLTAHAVGATMSDKTGARAYGRLIVLRGSVVGSVLVMSNDAKTITNCQPRVTAVIDSIQITGEAPAPAPAIAPSGSVTGTWSAGASTRDPSTGMSYGSQKRQYVFKADGTYTFKFEMWGGHLGSGKYVTVTESGAYAVDGSSLTVTPSSAAGIVRDRDGKVLEKTKPKLEKTVYAWKLHYFEGLKETQLVLVPPAQTDRDGKLGGNAAFPDAALYSPSYKPEWRH